LCTHFASNSKAIYHRPADENSLGPETEGFDDVDAGTDARVEENSYLVADCVDDLGKDIKGADRPIDLAACECGYVSIIPSIKE